jgi:hypothetical protein
VGFYERVLPSVGPFSLLSGSTGPDGKLIDQRHVNGLKTHADVEAAVQRLSAQPVNVFYAVGSYAAANRQDPVAKRCFYLDLDSKDFGSIEAALQDLTRFVKATGLPPPSIYVHSGRGIHVYWCLDDDIPVEEWLTVARALKAKCKELEFKADPSATTDAARILRCPGTLNRKEQTPLVCRVLSDNGFTYSIEQIADQLVTKIPSAVAKLAGLVANDDLVTPRATIERTAADIAELLSFVKLPTMGNREDWTTVCCAVQDWDKKTETSFQLFHNWSAGQPGYVSEADCRKTWDSFEPGGGITVGTLVKMAQDGGWTPPAKAAPVVPVGTSFAAQAQVVADTVTAVEEPQELQAATGGSLTIPIMIAAHHAVQASGNIRFTMQEAVNWLADEFVMVADQDGVLFSLTNRQPMAHGTIDMLLTRWMPTNKQGKPENATTILKQFGTRHSVHSMGFYPGQAMIYAEKGRSYANQYIPPGGMTQASATEIALIEDFWGYCFPREEDQAFSKYLLQCYGHLVQRPAVKIASAPLMISKEFGVGKTTLMYEIPRALVGDPSTKIVSNKVLRSGFSDFLSGAHFLHFDEVHINGRWDSDDTANSLKNLVTGTNVEIHPKGLKPYNIPNRVFVTATSNYEDAMMLPANDERRWGVYYLRPMRVWNSEDQRKAYFQVLNDWIKSDRGNQALRWYFSKVDLTGFNPQAAPPTTEAKTQMVIKSQMPEVQVLAYQREQAAFPFDREVFTVDQVRDFLHTETGKTHAGQVLSGMIRRAFPDARIVRQIARNGVRGNGINVWAIERHNHWEVVATPDEIRTELSR